MRIAVPWPRSHRYLPWSAIYCAVCSDNCSLRQKVELGHPSKFWDSWVLALAAGLLWASYCSTSRDFTWVDASRELSNWNPIFIFWIQEILIIYFKKKKNSTAITLPIFSTLLLVCMKCPMSYVVSFVYYFSGSSFSLRGLFLCSVTLGSSCRIHCSLHWLFLGLMVAKEAGWGS